MLSDTPEYSIAYGLKQRIVEIPIENDEKKMEWLESGERGDIERKFGTAKRRYTLDCIVTKLQETSETLIHSIVLFMNLRKKLRLLLHSFFRWLQFVLCSHKEFANPALG